MQGAVEDDAALVERARGAGPDARAAQRALYERHAPRLHGFLRSLVRDPEAARDLHQEAFLRAFRGLADHDPRHAFAAWLLRIGRNAALDHLRAQAKRQAAPLETHPDQATTRPGSDAARLESTAHTRAALDDLDDADRALLLQRHGLGLKLSELADTLACTERTVRNRLDRAAARLTAAVLARRQRS